MTVLYIIIIVCFILTLLTKIFDRGGKKQNGLYDRYQVPVIFEELKLDIEDILHDQNDINESTRAQLDAISEALAELQPKEPQQNPRRKIGFIQNEDV